MINSEGKLLTAVMAVKLSKKLGTCYRLEVEELAANLQTCQLLAYQL